MTVKHSHYSPRRGQLLLVILALLTMFALVAVTLVAITSQARRSAASNARIDQASDPYRLALDDAMRQVVRGSNNSASVMGAHSLLETMYGNGTIPPPPPGIQTPLTLSGVTPICGGQLLEIQLASTYGRAQSTLGGCVITMLTGVCAGQSSVIVGFNPTNYNPQVAAFESAVPPNAGDQCLINGVPFSGMGFGYNIYTGSLDAPAPSVTGSSTSLSTIGNALALLPNASENQSPTVSANTDYTAPDFQHMLLAAQEPMLALATTANPVVPMYTPIPSLHRPELINYWNTKLATPSSPLISNTATVSLLRAVMMRPNSIDHPYFTGSNPYFNPLWDGITPGGGQWDVDNDGDGIPDSVWVDLGAQIRTTADGRQYKPLFAILCVDLDGRLNLNAHGQLGWANGPLTVTGSGATGGNWDSTPQPTGGFNLSVGANEYALYYAGIGLANPPTSQTALTSGVLPRGLGYGPPEINLLPALTLAGTNAFAIYNNLFQGSGTLAVGGGTMAGRYGQFGLGGTGPQPGLPGQLAPLTFNKWYEFNGSYGGNFWNFAGAGFPLDAYGTPPDIFGCGAVGVDPAGRPLYFRMGGPINNSPYDLNLSRNAPRGLPTFALPSGTLMLNNPFSPAEFETILRPFDRDAPTLPNRLVGLCGVTITVTPTYAYTYSVLQATRHDLTTESWDSPTPPAALPKLARYQLATELVAMGMAASNTYTPPRHITDLFTAYGLYAANTSNTYVWDNVAPEMLAGLKLNLNQPLGAWRADPNQPSTATSPWFQQYAKPGAAPNWDGSLNFTPAGAVNTWSGPPYQWIGEPSPNMATSAWPPYIQARQRLARYLYVLMMLLYDRSSTVQKFVGNGLNNQTPDGSTFTPAQLQDFAARRIAQWAINAVTFACNDSAMVPFKYDPNFIIPGTTTQSASWHLTDDSIVPKDTTSPSAYAVSGDSAASFGVVWGCKPPELLLTETTAFHDRGVADTDQDNGSHVDAKGNPVTGGQKRNKRALGDTNTPPNETPADADLDQVRKPQGSLLVELYCPRSLAGNAPTNNNDPTARTTCPSDLYTYDPGSGLWKLDLGRMAPASNNGASYPVWRLVITRSIGEDTTKTGAAGSSDVLNRLASFPDTFSLETEQYSNDQTTGRSSLLRPVQDPYAGADAQNVKIDRIVWFTGPNCLDPTGNPYGSRAVPVSSLHTIPPLANRHYDGEKIYYNRSSSALLAGDQYVIVAPRLVTYFGSTKDAIATPQAGTPSPQRIDLSQLAGATPANTYANCAGTSAFPTPGSMIKPPLVIIAAAVQPTVYWAANSPAAVVAGCPGQYGIGVSVSEPLPVVAYYNGVAVPACYYPEPTQKSPNDPLGTIEWYDNPASPNGAFLDHPLETMSGQMNVGDHSMTSRPLVKEALLATQTTPNYKTVILQRLANPSLPYDPIGNPYRTVDWMPVDLTVFNGQDTQPAGWDGAFGGGTPATVLWDTDDPNCDIGKANRYNNVLFMTRQRAGSAPGAPDFPNIWMPGSSSLVHLAPTAGNVNFPFDLYNTLGYLNTTYWPTPPAPPGTPGLSIAGNVRSDGPYIGDPMQPFPWINWNNRPYISELELLQVPACSSGRLPAEFGTASIANSPYQPLSLANVPFPHLSNFFWSEPSSGAAAPNPAAPQLYRLLQYVGIPSRMTGCETFINPSNFSTPTYPPQSYFQPPFNRISRYREPGKINLNTIYSPDVWNGLMNYFPGTSDGALWAKFVQSRRSPPGSTVPYNATSTDPLAMDTSGQYPTRFGNPFRSFAGGDMVPLPQLQVKNEIDATLLRSDPTNPNRPLFQFDTTLATPIGAYNNPDNNSFFRYQALQRLGNLVTTRSNVYAIWITVGYFQVMPWPPGSSLPTVDAGHPDGYMLGPELGSDTGEVERHRAFYIYDRTIPVGFRRGWDTNIEKGLILRRYIE